MSILRVKVNIFVIRVRTTTSYEITNPTDDKIPSDIMIKLSSIEFNPGITSESSDQILVISKY